MSDVVAAPLTRKDFLSPIDPRWCAGCGCFSTLFGITRAFANTGIPPEKFAIVSGIGCSSRLPYYSSAYGFHTLHGRAPTVATGLKLVNPDLNVWIATGDGDGLSIGGNHFIHMIRKNPNIKLVLFNNQIYGLTKGQTSPTTPLGAKTKSMPYGSGDRPMHPLTMALGAGATFVARVPDVDGEMMYNVFNQAIAHKGTAIIEVLINCVIFNDGAFEDITNKETRPDKTVKLEADKPLIFGANRNKGIRMVGATPEVVTIGEGGVTEADILKHDPSNANSGYAFMLAEMGAESGFPVPLGVLRQIGAKVLEAHVPKPTPEGFLKVLRGSSPWNYSKDGKVSVGVGN